MEWKFEGHEVNFFNWKAGQPNNWMGDQNCAFMYGERESDGKWGDESCASELPFACQKFMTSIHAASTTTPFPPTTAPPSRRCRAGWTYNENGQCLKVTSPMSWPEASAACKAESSELVTFQNANENAAIRSVLHGIENGVWIGYTDEEHERVWIGSDGVPMSFANWRAGQPNNFGANGQNCAFMYTLYPSWDWGDKDCHTESLNGVCAMEPLPLEDPPADSCLQLKLNEICAAEDLEKTFARLQEDSDGEMTWQCFAALDINVGGNCVEYDGSMAQCYRGDDRQGSCARDSFLQESMASIIESEVCAPALCMQDRLDAFCNSMTTDGADGTRICRHADRPMFARFGSNKAGRGRPKWRCYADLLETSDTDACVDNDGLLTNHRCEDPDAAKNTYCSKGVTGHLLKLIEEGCPNDIDSELPVATTAATTTRQTTTRKTRRPTPESHTKKPSAEQPRHPLNKLAALERKLIDQVFSANFDVDSDWGKKAIDRIMNLLAQMKNTFNELNPVCNFFVEDDVRASEDERYDDSDHCKAFDQITRNMVKWTQAFNVPCDARKTPTHIIKFMEKWGKLAEYLKRKLPNQKCY